MTNEPKAASCVVVLSCVCLLSGRGKIQARAVSAFVPTTHCSAPGLGSPACPTVNFVLFLVPSLLTPFSPHFLLDILRPPLLLPWSLLVLNRERRKRG